MENLTEATGHALVQLVCCLAVAIVFYFACVLLVLLVRFLRVKFGRRVTPSGSKAVVITGATSGFGLATAKRLHARGFTVFACYFNDQESGYQQLLALEERGNRKSAGIKLEAHSLFLVQLDLRSSESVERAAREIERLLDAHHLRLHCLVNNAAICLNFPFELVTNENVRNVLDTNLAGTYQLTRALVLRLTKDQARVVVVSSGIYSFPGAGFTLYGSTKAALSYFSESLHQDLRPYGAGCYTIVPGKFLLQSNIVLARAGLLQRSLAQLGGEERKAFDAKIDQYGRALDGLLRARLARAQEDPKRLAALYQLELPDHSDETAVRQQQQRKSVPRKLIDLLVSLSDGAMGGSLELEQTGVIDCFESAILLERPPRHTYAGNAFYQFITGPILDYLPRLALNQLGRNMIAHLDSTR